MTDENILIHLSEENKKRQLFLKKIKLTDFPILKNIYNDFFNNKANYFKNKYKNNYLVIGKIQDEKEKEDINTKVKTYRGKYKKYMLNASKINSSKVTPEDTSHGEKKFVGAKFGKISSLKIGQHYVDETELEDLFKTFKTVHKINKSKTSDFITVRDLIEKKIKKESAINKKSEKKLKCENNEYNRTTSTWISNRNLKNENINININDSSKNSMKNKDTKENKDNKEKNLPVISKINSSKNINTQYINSDKEEEKKYKTMTNFFVSLNKKKNNKKKIRTRNKIINRQSQFLLNKKDINHTDNKHFAQILANQEKTLLQSSRSQTIFNHFGDKLSKKVKKSKNDLLVLNTDNYRIRQELRNRIDNMNKRLQPEHFYNWVNDLRTISSINSTQNIQDDKIRNPMKKEKYCFSKNNFRLKNFRKIINDINRDTYNYEGLIIQGQNLLQLEYNNAKSLKNRKIMNDFETYLPSVELEDKLFGGNTKFTKKNI